MNYFKKNIRKEVNNEIQEGTRKEDRPCDDRGAKLLLIFGKENEWR